jgi:hypothetical protein
VRIKFCSSALFWRFLLRLHAIGAFIERYALNMHAISMRLFSQKYLKTRMDIAYPRSKPI